MNDVTDAFGDWLTTHTITRSSQGARIDGRYQPGPETEIPIRAVIQNATADDVKVLEEGKRSSETIKLHTKTDLISLSEEDQIQGDTFQYKNKKWQVVDVARRYIGNYNKALAVRVKDES